MNYYNLLFLKLLFFCLIKEYHADTSNGSRHDINTQETGKQDNSTVSIEKITIKVYYETHCPASVTFFTAQLQPVVKKLGSYLDVHLIPYGHATTREVLGRYLFKCQHGPKECNGNKLHACAVDALQNNTKAVVFNSCLMQFSRHTYETDTAFVLIKCGKNLNLSVNGIWRCMDSERSSRLLKSYGDETHSLRLRYVPYILMDYSTTGQFELVDDLMTTVCRILQPTPPSCIIF
ncbi:GILT-like protein 1 [Achroia grisella]|uniref:GILT-like protein 1 n=1 Tax=Achroia grisella TaxID=688607 RepID=UPI0027D2AF9A|nr:GILT-like protein 1 [Achroia grisella]